MKIKGWKKIANEEDYKLWKNIYNKKIAVFKNLFTTPSGRRHYQKSHSLALKYAISYMRRHPNG
jgi:hypothetical protein